VPSLLFLTTSTVSVPKSPLRADGKPLHRPDTPTAVVGFYGFKHDTDLTTASCVYLRVLLTYRANSISPGTSRCYSQYLAGR